MKGGGEGLAWQLRQLLRLFTALRGIAGMKFSEEEVKLIVRLITRRPPPNVQGTMYMFLSTSGLR